MTSPYRYNLRFLLLSWIALSLAFLPHPNRSYSRSVLFGLPEWRKSQGDARPMFFLPFAADEALLQGQTREIVLKEGRFFDLFQDSMDDHESIVGMALMGYDGILDEMPLCEIIDFEVNSGFRGKITITVTLRAVARAKMVETTQIKPVMMGTCKELVDEASSDLTMANGLVNDMEAIIKDLSKIDGGFNRQECYDKAYKLALETDSQAFPDDSSSAQDKRTLRELVASSWAVFTVVSDPSSLHKAVAMTNLIERLQFGLKTILDEKYHTSSSSFKLDYNAGFE